MLTKEIVIDQITADEHGNLMYRKVTRIMEDGKELSHSYHRSSLMPGSDLTGIDPKVCLMAQATWTPELIAPFTAAVTANIAEQTATKVKFEAETAACNVAKSASEAAKVDAEAAKVVCDIACAAAKVAADAQEIENKRLADAIAVAEAAKDAEIAALKATVAA